MQRSATGAYATTHVGGEEIRAFVPAPLPPAPPLAIDGPLQRRLEAAALAIGRLDGACGGDAHAGVLRYACVRKEAVLSSRVEGIHVSLEDLLRFELGAASGTSRDDLVEVANHVRALEHGLQRLREGMPPSGRLLRELHGILLSSERGRDKAPGAYRREQNWIGGGHPVAARFVPPPPGELEGCMAALDRFLSAENAGLPLLARAALAHAQFERIHPFRTGNGRLGRLLVSVLFESLGLTREPMLAVSTYVMRHRATYYERLDQVSRGGDWEAWVAFFLDAVREAADDAAALSRALAALFASDRERIRRSGRRASSALRVHRSLMASPVLSIPAIRERAALSYPACSASVDLLVDLGIARQMTRGRRNRVFGYGGYLAILTE